MKRQISKKLYKIFVKKSDYINRIDRMIAEIKKLSYSIIMQFKHEELLWKKLREKVLRTV